MQSYDYARREGVEEIGWERFAQLSRALAEKLASRRIDAVVGIARACLFPATAVACALRCDLHPVRVTRRVNDQVVALHPEWKVGVPPEVRDKVVAVVDDIADTGETLAMVAARVRECGAAQVVAASLVSHSWANPMPEVVGVTTDALVIFPWDKQVFSDRSWHLHPELVAALKLQGLAVPDVISP